MKKFLFIFTVLAGTAYGQPSSSISNDTLCFQVPVIRKLLIDAEQGKLLKQQVVILNDRIVLLQSMVNQLEAKDSLSIISYGAEIRTMKEQRDIFQEQIIAYETLLKKERRKRRLITAGGILTTGAALFLSLKK